MHILARDKTRVSIELLLLQKLTHQSSPFLEFNRLRVTWQSIAESMTVSQLVENDHVLGQGMIGMRSTVNFGRVEKNTKK